MSSVDGESDLADGQENNDLESEDQHGRNESHGDDDLSEDDRSGRFYGPDSSWRFYTQAERALLASLDQAENNDLSIHLYNAHAWKQQHRDEQRIAQAKPWDSKQQWIRPDEQGKLPFLPPPTWTAWPLRPEDVPRSTEQWGVPVTTADEDRDTIRGCKSWRPSLHLQEEVEATFLRLAKERFNDRDWADDQADKAVKAVKTSRSRRSSFVKAEDDSDEPLDDLERLEEQLRPGSSPFRVPNTERYSPTILDDDDAASRILQPEVRHLLTKFDHLLIALHISRLGHRKAQGASRSRSRGSRSRSRSQARPQSSEIVARKRKRVASDADNQKEDDDELESPSDDAAAGANASRQNPNRYTLGTRDWSEVVGIAALVGFDQSVIDLTTRRCATLFREGMTMRTMPEVLAGTSLDQITEYSPDMIPPIASETDAASSDESSEEEVQIHTCPVATCARHHRPFEQKWRLNEHLKRKHNYTDGQLREEFVKQYSRASSANASSLDEESSASAEADSAESESVPKGMVSGRSDFLQPITLQIGRSRDVRVRKTRSVSSRGRPLSSRIDDQIPD